MAPPFHPECVSPQNKANAMVFSELLDDLSYEGNMVVGQEMLTILWENKQLDSDLNSHAVTLH